MYPFFQNVLTASFHGSIVILAVLILRLVLGKAPKKFICWLWTLAGLRLLMPIPLQSSLSLQPRSIPISVDLSAYLPIVWVVVAALIGSYSFLSYLHLRRKVLDAVKVPGGWESDRIDTAFVLGFVRPKIYIPTGMPAQTKQQILAHERTHLDKGDHWIKVIGFLALALHWFNPLVWVSYILLCKDIEMACDERVVQFMELEERKAYSAALLRCSTNRAHYAACPVAFGEVSVKYRIKSVLNYHKPSFWLSVLCLIAIAFVAVCLMTSPETTVEVPVDPDVPLQEISHEAPEAFTPAVLPPVEPNPDWGIEVIVDATSPTSATVVYAIQERFMVSSEHICAKNGTIDRWNGTDWEPVPSLAGDAKLLPEYILGFARSRDTDMFYTEEDLDWSLKYGPLPAGDYRMTQTVESDNESAVFQTAFHIYREELPKEEEAALTRCNTALKAMKNSWGYTIVFSETDLNGEVSPVKMIAKANGDYRIEHYLGEFVTSTAVVEAIPINDQAWDTPFRLDQNRQFLFPEGQSLISQEEITFQSVWADYQNSIHHGSDTFRFFEDGSLKSIDRTVQTLDSKGTVANTYTIRLDAETIHPYSSLNQDVQSYEIQDSFDAQTASPWGIFFRVDDDYLNPSGGEIWLCVDAIGVSNYTTDGKYWLEKKEGDPWTTKEWKRLGGETKEASWGDETIPLVSRTTMLNVDWTADYGELDAGVYRMGKRFYNGEESIIQYAEFAIYQTGGIYGEGAEEALARVNAAMDKLQSGSYRVEQYNRNYSDFASDDILAEVIWRYNDTVVYDFYNDAGQYSHSALDYPKDPNDDWHMNWWERSTDDSPYHSIYFGKGQSIISDREIYFAQSMGQDSAENPCTFYTYLFDENGELTEMRIQWAFSGSKTYDMRYVVTDTPESEIRAWVEEKQAEQ